MKKILTIATAGLYPDQLGNQKNHEYSRVDYLELRKRIGTDILNYNKYNQSKIGFWLRNFEKKIHSDLYLTLLTAQKQTNYDLVFAMSERVGIPFAVLRKVANNGQKFVTMFTCWSQLQEFTITKLNLFSKMDAIFVHCESMKNHLVSIGACEEKIHIVRYSVDQTFFMPQPNIDQQPNFIFSIGETRSRDYGMLFRAVEDLTVNLKVAAGGSWYALKQHQQQFAPIPGNAQIIGHLSERELREIYTRAQFVVLPIHDLVYSAGATGAMEAASMERAVIATRSQGITDYIIDGETGILVSPGDDHEMKTAIDYLISNPKEACRMGKNGRLWVEEKRNLENYVDSIASILLQYSIG
jgi:glycosyltransferase involved in cell wall biosynthesis